MRYEHINCELCGKDDTRLLFTRKDYRFQVSEELFNVVQCRNCSLVYLNPRPTEDEIHNYYTTEFYEAAYTPELALKEEDKKLRGMYEKVKHLTPGRLLDIGCYKGEFMYYMQQRGWEVNGVEFSSTPPNLFNLDIFYGQVDEAPYPPESFDLITLWAVFEHVYHPRSILKSVFRLLKPNGKVVMLIPNFNSIPGRFMREDDIPRHVIMFTRRTVTRMLKEEHFKPVRFYFDNEVYNGSIRGMLNFIVKLLAGERVDDIVAQNRTPSRWSEFSSTLKGKYSKFMLKIDGIDIAITPYLDHVMTNINLGFMMTFEAEKDSAQ